ncbi:MAG: hypothetical protein QW470_00925 [Candidatus Caldarchaeum sp.]
MTSQDEAGFSGSSRVAAALSSVARGAEPQKVVRNLSWREMEEFVSAACGMAGFQCVRDLRLKFGQKRIQVDVVAATPSLCLVIDCKRWKRRLSGQALNQAVVRCVERTKVVAEYVAGNYPGENLVFFMPLMLSLYGAGRRVLHGVFVLSVDALTSVVRSPEQLLAGSTVGVKLSPSWLDFLESYNLNQSRLKKV